MNDQTLDKPRYSEPCNGCGLCCRIEPCGLALEILGDNAQAPCQFLIERDGRTWCGVVEAAAAKDEAFGGWFAWRLGIGVGCQFHDEDIAEMLKAQCDGPADGNQSSEAIASGRNRGSAAQK